MPIVIDRLRGLFRFELFGQVLFFFTAGSPFCTSSAYPWGAYRIPLGTGLLIPSRKRSRVYINVRGCIMKWPRFFRRRRWDEERSQALEAHLQIEIDENMARGMTAEDARYAARKKLGNSTLIRE